MLRSWVRSCKAARPASHASQPQRELSLLSLCLHCSKNPCKLQRMDTKLSEKAPKAATDRQPLRTRPGGRSSCWRRRLLCLPVHPDTVIEPCGHIRRLSHWRWLHGWPRLRLLSLLRLVLLQSLRYRDVTEGKKASRYFKSLLTVSASRARHGGLHCPSLDPPKSKAPMNELLTECTVRQSGSV